MARSSRSVAAFLGLIAVLMLSTNGAGANDAEKLAYGEFLSGQCVTCHRRDGENKGIPSITGWPREEFVLTMQFYQNGMRDNQAMVSVSKSLGKDEVEALAVYFGSLPKPERKAK